MVPETHNNCHNLYGIGLGNNFEKPSFNLLKWGRIPYGSRGVSPICPTHTALLLCVIFSYPTVPFIPFRQWLQSLFPLRSGSIVQESANYYLQAKSPLPSAFVNKDLLEQIHAHLFM